MLSNILIVEDDSLVALDIKEIIEENGYKVVDVCQDAASAFACLAENKADFALLDINLKDSLSGVDIAKHINKNYKIPFAYITAYTDDKTLEDVKETKPVGFVVKPFEERQIIAAIKIGTYVYDENFNNVEKRYTLQQIKRTFNHLSERETEVLEQLLKAYNNKEIADTLHLSVNTVKVYMKTLFSKLQVSSRLEAVHQALEELNK